MDCPIFYVRIIILEHPLKSNDEESLKLTMAYRFINLIYIYIPLPGGRLLFEQDPLAEEAVCQETFPPNTAQAIRFF